MKKVTLVVAALCAATLIVILTLRSARAAEFASMQTREYVTIRYAGPQNTHLIRSNGEVEFLGPILVSAKRPERVDDRAYYMNLAINAVAREGFEVVAFTGDTVLLQRPIRK